jgi:hypothetical protein
LSNEPFAIDFDRRAGADLINFRSQLTSICSRQP